MRAAGSISDPWDREGASVPFPGAYVIGHPWFTFVAAQSWDLEEEDRFAEYVRSRVGDRISDLSEGELEQLLDTYCSASEPTQSTRNHKP